MIIMMVKLVSLDEVHVMAHCAACQYGVIADGAMGVCLEYNS